MSNTKSEYNKTYVAQSAFNFCLVTGKWKNEILREYKGRENGVYYLNKFENNLKLYNLSLKDYVIKFLKIEWPKCPTSGEDVGYVVRGKGLIFSQFKRGQVNKANCEAFRLGCEKLSADRMGDGNPMHGKDSWNKGLSLEDDRVRAAADKNRGRKASKETREKQKLAREKHPLKARHTQKHSEESKRKCREGTAKGWASGRFNKKTSIEQKMEDYLSSLSLREKFVFQHQHGYFTLDFAFPDVKVGIECQGTFFHTDPRKYPNGPITEIQKRNLGRDESKRAFFESEGWKIIESWEIEINNDKFKDQIKCALLQLNLLQN